MDGEQFDTIVRTAATNAGRRAVLRGLGGSAAGALLALLGSRTSSGADKGKDDDRGKGDQKDKDKDKGCCCSCPPTSSVCTVAVCDASSGECAEVERLSHSRCVDPGSNQDGICQNGRCNPCPFTLCPSIFGPPGTFDCVDLQQNGDYCGSCDNHCDPRTEICRNGQCVSG